MVQPVRAAASRGLVVIVVIVGVTVVGVVTDVVVFVVVFQVLFVLQALNVASSVSIEMQFSLASARGNTSSPRIDEPV